MKNIFFRAIGFFIIAGLLVFLFKAGWKIIFDEDETNRCGEHSHYQRYCSVSVYAQDCEFACVPDKDQHQK